MNTLVDILRTSSAAAFYALFLLAFFVRGMPQEACMCVCEGICAGAKFDGACNRTLTD